MMATIAMELIAQNDARLVADSLKGNREAFGEIVSRYQSLICSLAYSATGSLSHSEDLTQETFVTAWKQLFHTLIWMPMGIVIWQVLRLRKQRRQRQLAKEGGAQ